MTVKRSPSNWSVDTRILKVVKNEPRLVLPSLRLEGRIDFASADGERPFPGKEALLLVAVLGREQ